MITRQKFHFVSCFPSRQINENESSVMQMIVEGKIRGVQGGGGEESQWQNGLYPSYIVPLFQNESSCTPKLVSMKMIQ